MSTTTIAETYRITTDQTAVTVSQTAVDAVRRKSVVSTGVRLYGDGHIGVAGGLGDVDSSLLRDTAAAALERGVPYTGTPGSKLVRHEHDSGEGLPSEDEFVGEIEAVLEHLRREHPGFSFSNLARRTRTRTSLVNDVGLDLADDIHSVEISLMFKEKSSANILDGGVWIFDRAFDRHAFLDYADMVVGAYGERADLPGGRVPVVFADTDELPLLKFYEDLHGLRYGSGASALCSRSGEQMFSHDFTLFQSRHRDDTTREFFDAEGVVNAGDRVALIDHGVVVSPYTDKKTAARFDLPTTGAAGAEYDAVPGVSPPPFSLLPSDRTAAELLDGRPGVFIAIASGGDFTPSGEFGSPVQLAFLYDGKRLLARLPEFKLSGNLYRMFGDDYIGVSRDTLHPAGRERLLMMTLEM